MSMSKPKVGRASPRAAWIAVVAVLAVGFLVGSAAMAALPAIKIVSYTPTYNQAGVAPDAPIQINFNGPVKDVADQGGLVSGANPKISIDPQLGAGDQQIIFTATRSADRKSFLLTHSVPFKDATPYRVRITGPIFSDDTANFRDSFDPPDSDQPNPMLFTTLDRRPPFIVSHQPADGDTNVPVDAAVVINFNKPMDPTTVQVTRVPDVQLVGTWDATGMVLTLTHAANTAFQGGPTTYTFTVVGQDLSGNSLTANPSGVNNSNRNPFSFTTHDTTPPTLASSTPANGAQGVAPDAPIVLNFNEKVKTDLSSFVTPGQGGTPTFKLLIGDTEQQNITWTVIPRDANGTQSVTLLHDVKFQGGATYKFRLLKKDDSSNALQDVAGNQITSQIEFTFTIRDTTPPTVVSSMPPDNWGYPGGNPSDKDPFDALTVPNGSRWTPTGEITITFSKPINPATFAIDFRKEGATDQVGGIQLVWSQNNTVVVIRHDKLEANDISDYQLTITSAKDLSGNDLVPGAISDNVLNFRTQDLQAPGVASTDPTHGALLHPTGTREGSSSGSAPADQIVVSFTEKVFNKGGLDGAWTSPAPVIRLAYADGATPPIITNATPVGQGTGIYTLDQDSAWNSTGTAVTLTVAPYDANTGFRYIPGDELIATITSATDKYGNGGANVRSVAPNPWVVDIEDTRPATIKGVTIGSTQISADQAQNGPAPFTAQDSTIAIRFSKAMNSVTYTDTHAAGQPADAWSPGPITLTPAANPNNFSGDHRVVYLKLSQAGLPNADITHTISITAATDSNNVAMDPNSQFKTFSFKTGPKPYVVKVEYQQPTAFQSDNSGDGLRRDGTLGRNDDFTGQLWQWATIAQADAQHVLQPVLTGTDPVVPLNSKIRVTFSQSMDPTSVPVLTSQPASTGWSVAWSNNGAISNAVATFSHSTLFTDSNVVFGSNGMPNAPRYVMQVGSGADFKGDALESTPSFNFTTVDVAAPSVTVEYQTNTKDDGTWDGDPVWAPLTNGTSNVPIKTRFRITANETIGPWGSPLDPNATPLVTIAKGDNTQSDITAANPQVSTRQTPTSGPSNGIVGSRVIVTLGQALAGGYLDSNGYEQRSSYRVLFTVKDTRKLGDPNATTQDITFTTVDRMAPQIHDISPSASAASSPDTPIVVTFTEPVNPDTVSISNEGNDSGDVTFTTKEVSNGGKTITFRHTPFSQPTSGSPFTFNFHVNGGYKDLVGNTQGSQSATFTVTVPAETVPPTVVSMVSTRDTVVMEFSEPVISATATGDNATFDVRSSAANTANYLAPLAATGATGLGSSSAALSNNADLSTTSARNAAAGKVSYVFYDSTPVIGPNNTTVPYGWRVVNKNIASVQYNADTRTATLILDSPLTEGQGSGQPEFVVVRARGNDLPNYPASSADEPRIRDLSTNSLVNGRRQTSPQEGRLDWQINLGVTTNVPGASIDTHNVIGVRAGAVDGFGGGDEDIPKVLPPLQNFVYLASQHSDSEPGWSGAGGVYAQDLMSRPGLNDVRSWPKIGITTDLGAAAAPATITLTWDLKVPGHEVPYFDAVELLDPSDINGDGIKSYDMRKISSFSFQVATDGILTTQFLGIKVYTPSTVTHQFATGFNLMSVPVAPINPAPSSVFFGLSPLFAYRYDSTAQQYDIYPMVPSFDSIEAGRGYWIQPKAPTTISVLGSRVVGTQSIQLKAGWNLIGSPFGAPVSGSTLLVKSGGTVMSVAQAVKAGIVDGNLLSYDNAQRSYVPSDLATGVMNPWVGYWLLANQDAELLISNPS